MSLSPGNRLGPYEILLLIGSGGMGEVYRARDTRIDRPVAIKVLPSEVAADPHRQERFRREARAISSLAHPHICTLHDLGDQDGIHFLVMEYLSGETLAQRLLRGPLPLDQVLRIGAQLADGLDAAHRQGLIHRDLKPANVMLTASGAKILDFGVAKWHGTDSDAGVSSAATVPLTVTQVGALVGTVQYMAPEQVEGNPADARSDLFALGAILYEMTTGKRAFEGSSQASVTSAILNATPTPVATLAPMTPPALDRLVRKCLAKDPASRWQTAADLRDELAWIEQDPAARALPPAAPTSVTQGIWRRSAWPFATAAMVVAVTMVWLLNRTRSVGSPAPMRFAIMAPDDTRGTSVPVVSPDGRAVAFVARESDGNNILWVRTFDSVAARPIIDVDDRAFPFWSFDSRFLAFFGEGKLKKIGAAGGPVQVLGDAPTGRGGTWNGDDVILFAPAATGPLYRISGKGGAAVQVTTLAARPAERSHRFPHFLPDGHHFTFSSQSDQPPAIVLGSLDSPEITRLVEGTFSEAWAPPGYLLFLRNYPLDTLMTQRFDPAQLRLTDEAVPVVDRVKSGASGGNFGFSVSDNGVLAYTTYSVPETQLTWVARTNRQVEPVGPKGEYGPISLSPDGNRVAVTRINHKTGDEEVWIIDLVRGVGFPLTSSPPAAWESVWSPDGSRVAFTKAAPSGFDNIFVRSSTGSGNEEPVLMGKQIGNWVLDDWSGDGRLLLLELQEGAQAVNDLWILPLDDHKPRPYLRSSFNKTDARFSPDGRWVSYVSNDSGVDQIYVQSFPEPAFRSQVSVAGGSQPHWRRDGRELFFLAADRTLMAVPVRTSPTFEAGAPVALFELPNEGSRYDVTADGQRYLITRGLRELAPSPINVVLNWQEDLKQRVSKR